MHTRHVLFLVWLEYFSWDLPRFKYWNVNPTVSYKECRNLNQLRCFTGEWFEKVHLDWIKLLGSGPHDWAQWLYNRLHMHVLHLLSWVFLCNLWINKKLNTIPGPSTLLFQNQKLKQIFLYIFCFVNKINCWKVGTGNTETINLSWV